MSYNTDHTRFKSSDLAALDCGSYLKIPRRDRVHKLIARYTGDLEVGQCVAMVRVPAGARIVSSELTWAGSMSTTSNSILVVGDPFACGRLSNVISTALPSGTTIGLSGAGLNCAPWGLCGRLTKTGNIGDGCGLFYQYTCETDIIVTNLTFSNQATFGGYATGAVAAGAGVPGVKWTGGALVLTIEYLSQS